LIKLTHEGDSNFIVDQLDSDLDETENLVNEIGKYKGTTILDVTEEEETKLKIEADGTWTIVLSDLTTHVRWIARPAAGVTMCSSIEAEPGLRN
jgi:hypothetical protein